MLVRFRQDVIALRPDVVVILAGTNDIAGNAGQTTADAILDVAEECGAGLIVVGNKGMTGAKRFLLGSVPNKVSHHAPCSVLIIRTT